MAQIGEHTFRYRLRDAMTHLWNLSLPMDRPSPTFTLLAVFLNSIEIIIGCTVAFSAPCSIPRLCWCTLGIFNAMVNTVYALAVMFRTRQSIDKGIPMHVGIFRPFLSEPVNIAFMVFVIWEIVWMSIAVRMSTGKTDQCASHLSFQLGFLSAFLIIGSGLLMLTFVTEFCQTPRWRIWAHANYRKRLRSSGIAAEQDSLSYGVNAMASAGKKEATAPFQGHHESHRIQLEMMRPRSSFDEAVSDTIDMSLNSPREGIPPSCFSPAETYENYGMYSNARESGNVFPSSQAQVDASQIPRSVHSRVVSSSLHTGNVVAAMSGPQENNPVMNRTMITPESVVIEFSVSDRQEREKGDLRPNNNSVTNAYADTGGNSGYTSGPEAYFGKKR